MMRVFQYVCTICLLFLILFLPALSYSQNIFIRYYEEWTERGFENLLSEYEKDVFLSYWKVILNRNLVPFKAEYYEHDVISEVIDFMGDIAIRKELYSEGELSTIIHYNTLEQPISHHEVDYWLSDMFERDGRQVFWCVYFDRHTKQLLQATLSRAFIDKESNVTLYRHTGPPVVKLYWNNERYVYRQELYDEYGDLEWLTIFRNAQESDTNEIRGFYIDQEKFRQHYLGHTYFAFYRQFNENTAEYNGKLPRGLALLQDSYKIIFDHRDFPVQVEYYRYVNRRTYYLERMYTLEYHRSDQLKRLDAFKPDATQPDYSFTYDYRLDGRLLKKTKFIYKENYQSEEAFHWEYEYDSDELLILAKKYKVTEPLGTVEYIYDEEERLIEVKERDKDGNWGKDYEYEYNLADLKSLEIIRINGYRYKLIHYRYDAAGNILAKTEEQLWHTRSEGTMALSDSELLVSQDESGEPYYGDVTTVYEYAPDNLLETRVSIFHDTNTEVRDFYEHPERIVRREVYKNSVRDHFLYLNEHGDCIREEVFNSNGSLLGYHHFFHTDTGNVVRVETYNRHSDLQRVTHFTQYATGLFGEVHKIEDYDSNGAICQTRTYPVDRVRVE